MSPPTAEAADLLPRPVTDRKYGFEQERSTAAVRWIREQSNTDYGADETVRRYTYHEGSGGFLTMGHYQYENLSPQTTTESTNTAPPSPPHTGRESIPFFPCCRIPLTALSLTALERLQNVLDCFCFPDRFNRKLDYSIHCYSQLGLEQPWDGHIYQLITRHTHSAIYRTKYALSFSEKLFLLHRLTRRLHYLQRGKKLVERLGLHKFWPKVYREPTAKVVKFLQESTYIVELGVREGEEVWPGVMDWVSAAMCDGGMSPELFDSLWGVYRKAKEEGWVGKVKERGLRFGRRMLRRVPFA
jgi:hypothetical protein